MMANAEFFRNNGYLTGLQVFDAEDGDHLVAVYERLRSLLPFGEPTERMDWWHARDKELWDICTHSRILDLVEEILGPDFFLWGSQYFCKDPGVSKTVPWHQDASYWPFDKSRCVTAWLAIDDADAENAAMQFLPGTHRMGHLEWKTSIDPAANPQEIVDAEKLGEPFLNALQAGEASLHADMLAHGSDPNNSQRRRCGLTLRYAPLDVRALTNWHEQAIICRGSDSSNHWPHHPRPDGEYW